MWGRPYLSRTTSTGPERLSSAISLSTGRSSRWPSGPTASALLVVVVVVVVPDDPVSEPPQPVASAARIRKRGAEKQALRIEARILSAYRESIAASPTLGARARALSPRRS